MSHGLPLVPSVKPHKSGTAFQSLSLYPERPGGPRRRGRPARPVRAWVNQHYYPIGCAVQADMTDARLVSYLLSPEQCSVTIAPYTAVIVTVG